MSGLDWRKAHLAGKRSLSIPNEEEFRERDAAARWLTRQEAKKPGKARKRRHRAARAPQETAE